MARTSNDRFPVTVPTRARRRAAAPVLALALLFLTIAPFPVLHAQDELPPEVRFDILRLELDDAAAKQRHKDVLVITDKMRKTGLPLPPEASFLEARAFHALGAGAMARRALVAYLKEVGRGGAHYDEAIRLFVEIKSAQEAAARRRQAIEALKSDFETARAAWRADKERIEQWKTRAVVFGGPGADVAAALAPSPDGGLVAAGALHVQKDQEGKALDVTLPWITAFDAKGRRVWHRPLGAASDDGSLRSVVPLPGRGYLFGGTQKGFQVAAVTDRLGNMVGTADGDPWIIAFAPASEGAGGIARLLPGGDIVAFGAEEIGKDAATGKAAARLPVMVRLAPDGTLKGKSVFGKDGGALWYDLADARVLEGGDVVFAGTARRGAGDAHAEAYVIRAAPDGTEIWSKRIAPVHGKAMAVAALAPAGDGGVIAAGRDGAALAYFKLAADGSLAWRKLRVAPPPPAALARLCAAEDAGARLAKAFEDAKEGEGSLADLDAVRRFACRGSGAPFAAATAIAARGDGFVILGLRGRDGEAGTRVTLTAINAAGDAAWESDHGDAGASHAAAALATRDGGLVVAGGTENWGPDALLFKADAAGKLTAFAALTVEAPPAPKPASAEAKAPLEKAPKPEAAKPAPAEAAKPEVLSEDLLPEISEAKAPASGKAAAPETEGKEAPRDGAEYDLLDLFDGLFGGGEAEPAPAE